MSNLNKRKLEIDEETSSSKVFKIENIFLTIFSFSTKTEEKITVQNNIKIFELKKKLGFVNDIEYIDLFYNNKKLENENFLNDYNINNGDVLYLLNGVYIVDSFSDGNIKPVSWVTKKVSYNIGSTFLYQNQKVLCIGRKIKPLIETNQIYIEYCVLNLNNQQVCWFKEMDEFIPLKGIGNEETNFYTLKFSSISLIHYNQFLPNLKKAPFEVRITFPRLIPGEHLKGFYPIYKDENDYWYGFFLNDYLKKNSRFSFRIEKNLDLTKYVNDNFKLQNTDFNFVDLFSTSNAKFEDKFELKFFKIYSETISFVNTWEYNLKANYGLDKNFYQEMMFDGKINLEKICIDSINRIFPPNLNKNSLFDFDKNDTILLIMQNNEFFWNKNHTLTQQIQEFRTYILSSIKNGKILKKFNDWSSNYNIHKFNLDYDNLISTLNGSKFFNIYKPILDDEFKDLFRLPVYENNIMLNLMEWLTDLQFSFVEKKYFKFVPQKLILENILKSFNSKLIDVLEVPNQLKLVEKLIQSSFKIHEFNQKDVKIYFENNLLKTQETKINFFSLFTEICLPTGTGKTFIACFLIKEFLAKFDDIVQTFSGKTIIFQNLLNDSFNCLNEYSFPSKIEQIFFHIIIPPLLVNHWVQVLCSVFGIDFIQKNVYFLHCKQNQSFNFQDKKFVIFLTTHCKMFDYCFKKKLANTVNIVFIDEFQTFEKNKFLYHLLSGFSLFQMFLLSAQSNLLINNSILQHVKVNGGKKFKDNFKIPKSIFKIIEYKDDKLSFIYKKLQFDFNQFINFQNEEIAEFFDKLCLQYEEEAKILSKKLDKWTCAIEQDNLKMENLEKNLGTTTLVYKEKIEKEKKMDNLKMQINQLNSTIQRIRQTFKENCCICLESFDTVKAIPLTCEHLLCSNCFLTCLQTNLNCPYRCGPVKINSKFQTILEHKNFEKNEKESIFSKLINFLDNIPVVEKILLIYNFKKDNQLDEPRFKNYLKTKNYVSLQINCNDSFTKAYKEFENNPKMQLMIINQTIINYGLNFQFVDHLIILNDLNKNDLNQIIGRVERIGRIKPCNIIQFKLTGANIDLNQVCTCGCLNNVHSTHA